MERTCPGCGTTKEIPVTEKRTSVRCSSCGTVFDGVRCWNV
jgi:uncharacterized Zn finger protein